jgi:hypothetical protein
MTAFFTSTAMRSRVTPGSLWTMEMRRPARRLKMADLPTLGRPTMARRGRNLRDIRIGEGVAGLSQLADAITKVEVTGDHREEGGEVDQDLERPGARTDAPKIDENPADATQG